MQLETTVKAWGIGWLIAPGDPDRVRCALVHGPASYRIAGSIVDCGSGPCPSAVKRDRQDAIDALQRRIDTLAFRLEHARLMGEQDKKQKN